MTDYDELRRLAAAAKRARTAGRTVQDMADSIHFQEACITAIPELLDALEAAPAWHKRPTCPGLWVCHPSKEITQWVALELSQERIDAGAPFCSPAVYGPIPNPPEETTT